MTDWFDTIAALARDATDIVWNPSAAEADFVAFEARHRVTLPDDYKRVMATIGNGCEGAFTVFPVGYARMDFEEPLVLLERGGSLDLGRPFPLATSRGYWHVDADASPGDDEEDPYDEELEGDPDELDSSYVGVLPVGFSVSGLALLVVTGKDRGLVWEHELGSTSIAPMPTPVVRSLSFAQWIAVELAVRLGRHGLIAQWREAPRSN
jgi:hypothetical protein